MRSEKIRVMVVDDSAMIREFLRSILSTDPGHRGGGHRQ